MSAARDPAEQAALDWFVRLRSLPGPTAQQRQDFARWLDASADNPRQFAAVERAWDQSHDAARMLARDEAASLEHLLARMDVPHRPAANRTRRWSLASALAGLSLILLVGMWLEHPHCLQDFAADYVTPPGASLSVMLADGSQVTLDADSALAVDIKEGERSVRLLRGRAYFQVSHDGRPFVVATPGSEVRVLGTRFDVAVLANGTAVAVAEGKVAVRATSGTVTLERGQGVQVVAGQLATAEAVDPEAVADWRQGRLVFHDAPLADVVNTIARYHHGRIVLLDKDLGARRISGTFASDDPMAALRSLQRILGFRLYDVAGRLILLETQKT